MEAGEATETPTASSAEGQFNSPCKHSAGYRGHQTGLINRVEYSYA